MLNQSFPYNFLQKIFLLLLTFETRPIAISCVLQAINKQPMDRPTNKAVYRVVCMQLKKIIFKVWRTIFYHIPHFGKQKTTQKTCYQPMDLQYYGWTDITVAKLKTDLSSIPRFFAHFGVNLVFQLPSCCPGVVVLLPRCHRAPGERLVIHWV